MPPRLILAGLLTAVSWPFGNHNIWQDTTGRAFRRIGEMCSLRNSRHLVQPDHDPQLFDLGATNR